MNAHQPLVLAFLTALAAVVATFSNGLAAEGTATRFVRFRSGEQIVYGVVEGDRVRQIRGELFGDWKTTDKTYSLSEIKPLVPTRPTKVLAVAGNYQSHLGKRSVFTHPELFFKVPSCLIAAGEKIVIPKGTNRVDYEAEVVIVIGRQARHVSVADAGDYIFGITCGNDVSARDWQKGDVQWWRAKGSDTFGPCGPYILSGVDYGNLLLQSRLNGRLMQKQSTKDMVHNLAEIVSWASRHVTLEPGDLIYTGTPGKTTPMKPGDVIEIEIEGVGVLRNPVVAATD